MANTLIWTAFADADCDSFNLYRAITGVAVSFPNSLVTGDVLSFSATTPTIQNVTIAATDIATVASTINATALGLVASVSQSGSTLFLRCTASTNPKFKLYPCTFASHVSQAPRTVGPAIEFNLLANRTRDVGVFDYTYFDTDGAPSDWYRLTTVKGGIESIPSLPMQALLTPESLCVIEGRVVDLQNNPISGAQVSAAVEPTVGLSDNSGVSTPQTKTVTDTFGRWSMPLLQGQSVIFRIPSIGYNQVIFVPSLPYALFSTLTPVNDYYFSPIGDPQ